MQILKMVCNCFKDSFCIFAWFPFPVQQPVWKYSTFPEAFPYSKPGFQTADSRFSAARLLIYTFLLLLMILIYLAMFVGLYSKSQVVKSNSIVTTHAFRGTFLTQPAFVGVGYSTVRSGFAMFWSRSVVLLFQLSTILR